MQRKTAKGEGYTVRINGRKVLTSAVLEQQVSQAQRQHDELEKQNQLLRAKEAMQLSLLGSYEAALLHMGASASADADTGGSPGRESSVVAAALLDFEALMLMQELRPHQPADLLAPGSDSDSNSHQNRDSCEQQGAPLVGMPGTNNSSSSTNKDYSSSLANAGSRTTRMMASITPNDVASLRGISVVDLAGRFKAIHAQLALARLTTAQQQQQQDGGYNEADVQEAVDAYGKLCMMGIIACEQQLSLVIGLNLDTLQQDTPPAGMCERAVTKANLQPHQLEHICSAFHCFRQQQQELLQEQVQVKQQLQTLLDGGGPTTDTRDHESMMGGVEMTAALDGLGEQVASAAVGAHPPQSTRAAGWPVPAPSATTAATKEVAVACGESAAGASYPAGATGANSALSNGSRSRSSSTVDAAAGVLPVEDAERADELLQDLLRIARSLKQHSRHLVCMWMDLLTAEQHADVLLAGYPWSINIPAMCACVWQAQQANVDGK